MDALDWLGGLTVVAALFAFGPFHAARARLLNLEEGFEADHRWAAMLRTVIGLAALIAFALMLPNELPHG